MKLAKALNHAILKSMDRRQEDDLEPVTWSETAEELFINKQLNEQEGFLIHESGS